MDHTLYDLGFVFREQWFGNAEAGGFWFNLCEFARYDYFPWAGREMVWPVAVFCFIFISGISCSFSHSNIKRGLRLAVVALLLTAVTMGMDWFMGQEDQLTIRFGILHMLSASILLYCIFKKFGKIFMLFAGLFAIAVGIYFSYVPLETSSYYMGILVRSTSGFQSADYFPLLPYLGFFLIGGALGPWLYPNRRSLFGIDGNRGFMRPVLFTGRHSLIFYILHQPVVYGLLSLAGMYIK